MTAAGPERVRRYAVALAFEAACGALTVEDRLGLAFMTLSDAPDDPVLRRAVLQFLADVAGHVPPRQAGWSLLDALGYSESGAA